MANGSTFTEIGSTEHEINCSEDDTVDDIFTESDGSLQIYITSARQWICTEQNSNLSHRPIFLGKPQTPDLPIFLGKIQTPATEVFSTTLQFFDLLDLINNIRSGELQSVVEEIIHTFNVNPEVRHNLLEDIKTVINKSVDDIDRQKPREFEIEIFIDILAKEICSKPEFRQKYGQLFRGSTDAIFMRTKRYLEGEDSEKEACCCGICSLEFMPGVDEVVVMPCSDVFHKRWLNEKSNVCPVCYWTPRTLELHNSSSGLQRAKELFDGIQDTVDAESGISKTSTL